MKRFLLIAAMSVAAITTSTLAADVGVSVSIGQPGFYGQIDIGNFPQPRLVYAQPIVIDRGVPMGRAPIYLHVPPGHAKHWSKHCHEYHACNQRVYFVHDDWYEREYVPRYQEQHRDHRNDRGDDHRGNEHGKKNHDDRGHGNH